MQKCINSKTNVFLFFLNIVIVVVFVITIKCKHLCLRLLTSASSLKKNFLKITESTVTIY